ncbi:MAG: flavin reductase [Rhizobiales bacterium]|nr:flavin reductase [Hyphomicrobiales bacterium]
MSDGPIDPRALRQALGAFVTGVTVVTTFDKDGVPRGFTANSFTSVSLAPPLVLVCIAKRNGSFPAFAASDGYAVNILSQEQRAVANTFASPAVDRFSSVGWREGPAGHPVFEGVAAWFDCRRHDYVDAGDHLVLIGEVIGFDGTPHPPLGYCRGSYILPALEHEAASGARREALVSVILEGESGVLLGTSQASGALELPSAGRLGKASDPASLNGKLAAAGIEAELGFIFAVFDEVEGEAINIVYRGLARAGAMNDPSLRFYAFDSIPWHRIADEATRTMLRRFVTERLQARFGVYVGDRLSGRVEALDRTTGDRERGDQP